MTVGNRHDVTHLLPLADGVPRIKGVRGRLRQRPGWIYADRGYDFDTHRRRAADTGHHTRHRLTLSDHSSGLGTRRRVVEQTAQGQGDGGPPARYQRLCCTGAAAPG
ncbi:transposase [Micromonospora sp. NPDC004551]|uniref:transposase n=1 Tax=Micromonospora sp. NPDC004551 TaxID=3154284 RepID=UPI0033B38E8D